MNCLCFHFMAVAHGKPALAMRRPQELGELEYTLHCMRFLY